MPSPRHIIAVLAAACALALLPSAATATVTLSTNSFGAATYSVGSPAITVDPNLQVGDDGQVPTAEYIDYVTAQVLYGESGDALSYPAGDYFCPSSQDIIRAQQVNANSLILSIVDDGSVQGCTAAEWQSRLRLVTFSATASGNLRDVVFRAVSYDYQSDLATLTRNVNVSSPPQVSLPSATLGYTEDSGAVALAPDATVTHPAGSNITGATVQVTANYVSGQDVLALASPPGGISATFDAGTGTLTLSGTASASTYQAALRGVTYQNTANAPSTLMRFVRFDVTDGAGTATADMTVNVTAVNDAPQVVTSGGITTFTEGGAAVVVDSGLTLADADDLTLASATVSITSNFASGQDVLAFTNDGSTMGNIAGSYGAGTGVLTLSSAGATATKTQWRAALRAVTYANTSDDPSTANRTMSFQVNDGQASSAAATKTVAVVATNDAPVITTSGGTTAFTEGGGAVAVDGGVTVSDPDTATLLSATVTITGNFASGEDVLAFTNDGSTMGNITGAYNVGVGQLTLTSSGATATLAQWQAALRSVTYGNSSVAPTTNTRTVAFMVSDGTSGSSSPIKLVSVAAVDTPPVVTTTAGITAFTEDGGPVVVDSGVDAEDVDGIITSAKVSITGNFASGQDVLALPTQAFDITGSWNGSMGALTLTAGSTLTRAQWVTALRAVTYDNTSQAPSTAVRTMAFTVVDGAMQLGTAAKSVSVAGAADDPVLTFASSALAATEQVPVQVDAGMGVADPDGVIQQAEVLIGVGAGYPLGQDVLAFRNDRGSMGNIVGSYDAPGMVLTLTSAGNTATVAQWRSALQSVTYTNTSNTPTIASRVLTVRIRDAADRPWVSTTRPLVVSAANDAPSWTPITISIPMDDPWTFGSTTDLAFLYSDPEDDPLAQVKVTSVGAWGQVRDCNGPLALPATVSAANFLGSGPCPLRFVPVPGELGSNAIGLEVFDGQDWSGPQQLTLEATATPPSMAVEGGVITVPAGATVPVSGGLVLGSTLATGLPNGAVRVASGGAAGDTLGISVDFALPGEIISIGNNPLALDLVSFANQATPAQWQAALRTVTFRAGSTPGTRTITFEVSNGLSASRASVQVQVPDPAPPAGDGGAAAPGAPAPQGQAAVPAASIVRLTPAARSRAAFSTAVGRAKVARTKALAACAKRPAASRAACRTAATRTYTRTVALATAVRTRDLALARCATRKGAARVTCTKAANARYVRDRAKASRR